MGRRFSSLGDIGSFDVDFERLPAFFLGSFLRSVLFLEDSFAFEEDFAFVARDVSVGPPIVRGATSKKSSSASASASSFFTATFPPNFDVDGVTTEPLDFLGLESDPETNSSACLSWLSAPSRDDGPAVCRFTRLPFFIFFFAALSELFLAFRSTFVAKITH